MELNNRELSLFIWTAICAILLFISSRKIRTSTGIAIQSLFDWFFLRSFLLIALYVSAVIYLLFKIHLWNIELLKETIFWFLGSAVVLFFKVDEAKSVTDFKISIIHTLKWAVIVEFVTNLHVLHFWIEFTLMPLVFVLSILKAGLQSNIKYHKAKPASEDALRIINGLLTVIGYTYFLYAVYKTVAQYHTSFTMQHFRELIIAPILTIFFIPLLYLMAVQMTYQVAFKMVDHTLQNKQLSKPIKRKMHSLSRCNLEKINRIDTGMRRLWNIDEMNSYLNRIRRFGRNKNASTQRSI